MSAYTATTTISRTASSLAGPVLPAQRSRSIISLAPSPSLLPPPSFNTPPHAPHRPNKAELEARLAGAHIRAHNRRLREALGHSASPLTPMSPRTVRAPAYTLPRGDTTTTTRPGSSLYQAVYPQAGNHADTIIPKAPSPSVLPQPFASPRPAFPRRRSRAPVRGAVVGLGLSVGASDPFGFAEEDAPLTPHHVYPETLRRTPGAPLQAKSADAANKASYFHLPADIITPTRSGMGQGAIGLGILDVDLQYFPPSNV